MKVVIYQDLKDEGKQGYRIVEAPDGEEVVVIQQQVIPGLHGKEPTHITHLKTKHLLIIAQTDYELSITKRKSITRGAVSFYNVNSLAS